MNCPHCGHESTKVSDSRLSDGGSSIRRRRLCENCGHRFTTFERMQMENLMVRKKDETIEAYSREKLERAILTACGKRPVSLETIRDKLSNLEENWGKSNEVSSKKIGEDIVAMLKDIDEIAFIRFASVYRSFKDVETFKQELDKIL